MLNTRVWILDLEEYPPLKNLGGVRGARMEGWLSSMLCAVNGVVASSFSNSTGDAMNIISTVKGTVVLSKVWKELFSDQTVSFYPLGKKDGKVYIQLSREDNCKKLIISSDGYQGTNVAEDLHHVIGLDTSGIDGCIREVVVSGSTEIETCSIEVFPEVIGKGFVTVLASNGLETGPSNSNHALPIGEEFVGSSNKFENLCSVVELQVGHEVPSRSVRVAAVGIANLMNKLKPKENGKKERQR
ncbi:hypothetical protein V6N11_077148 [Hibiscus sabdariffa]|uniref:Uncharacterized protein n=1 Tax=Hibiscus sabdariffa TaxID=183260 RepID=A0ABR2TC78_9ROSI